MTHLIVYAGTNDLAAGCNGPQIIGAFGSIVRQAHAHRVLVLITTITPRAAYSKAQNADREQVNAWVRAGGTCSGECFRGLDFDVVVRDPHQRNRIDPKLDGGDGIHPTRRACDAGASNTNRFRPGASATGPKFPRRRAGPGPSRHPSVWTRSRVGRWGGACPEMRGRVPATAR